MWGFVSSKRRTTKSRSPPRTLKAEKHEKPQMLEPFMITRYPKAGQKNEFPVLTGWESQSTSIKSCLYHDYVKRNYSNYNSSYYAVGQCAPV